MGSCIAYCLHHVIIIVIPILNYFPSEMEVPEKSQQGSDENRIKKSFNKKKWREQKYSCKAKVQKWEHIKRKKAERQYNKELKKMDTNFKSKNNILKSAKPKKSQNSLKQAQLKFKEIQQMKEERRKEQERIRKEKIEAIKEYKEKKAERFKKLSQKTRKGQPLMRGRIELLLEKIQKKYVNNSS